MSTLKKLKFGELTWKEIQEAIEEDYILLLSVASHEEHGPYLPVDTDDSFGVWWVTEAAKLAHSKYNSKVLVLPAIHYGNSAHLMGFPGTLSISEETLIGTIFEVIDSAFSHGFRKAVIINAHGGNRPAVNIAARKLKAKYVEKREKVAIRVADDMDEDLLPASIWAKAALMVDEAKIGYCLHGGAVETARSLYIREDLVRKEYQEAEDEGIDIPKEVSFLHEVSRTKQGIQAGDPSKATKELGKLIWDALVENLAKYINEMQQITLEKMIR